jgi:hypothetical protein
MEVPRAHAEAGVVERVYRVRSSCRPLLELVDCYLPEAELMGSIKEHALSPANSDGNVRLRVVPDDAWALLGGLPSRR